MKIKQYYNAIAREIWRCGSSPYWGLPLLFEKGKVEWREDLFKGVLGGEEMPILGSEVNNE